jgi:FixJ family two-component response regulator
LFYIQIKSQFNSKMIAIIDDDKSVRRGFKFLLESAGFKCTYYGSAEDFLENWQKDEKDLLILDMHMPGMGGCDLLKYLKEKEIFIPVIVSTAYDEQESRECSKKYGAIAYLRKPIDGEALIDLIKFAFQNA